MCLQGIRGWKIGPKMYQTDVHKQMWNTAKYTKASPPARKMSLFSSIIITIILSYAIIAGLWNWGAHKTALSDWTQCIREN